MRARAVRALWAAAVAAGSLGVLAGPLGTLSRAAAATSAPYPTGTLFVADQNYSALWQVPSGGAPGVFEGYGQSDQDVATDPAGDLYWTQLQSGTVEELTAGGVLETLVSGVQPWGIAVDQAGDVYFGTFQGPSGGPGGLYELPVGGTTATLVTSQFGVFTSLSVDGNGDIWGAGGSAQLVVIPAGSTAGAPISVPGEGYIDGVRLDSHNDLYMSTGYGGVAAELKPGSTKPVLYGSGMGGFTEGVAVDGSGDVFVGVPSGTSGYGKVYEITPGGVQSLYASGGIAETGGLALYPGQGFARRSATTNTVSTASASSVTTAMKVKVRDTVSGATSGTVQFEDNGRPIGGPVKVLSGAATLTTTLPSGTNSITAAYVGSSRSAPSLSSNSVTFTATPIPSHVTLTFPGGTTIAGDSQLTVDAAVTGKAVVPTGSVDFYVNGKDLGAGNLDPSGHTSVSLSIPPGTDKVYGYYSGNSTYKPSRSTTASVSTTAPYLSSTTTKVSYGSRNAQKAKTATIDVTVSGVKVEPQPTGTVVADSGFTCSPLTAVSGTHRSVATCTATLAFRTYETVSISYSGDGVYDPSVASRYVYNGPTG